MKNRRYSQFPYEVVYERVAVDRGWAAEGAEEWMKRIQVLKIYAEEIEMRVRF